MRYKRRALQLAVFLVLPILLGAWSCNASSWERTTFQTLAANQAVLNQAQADYEARVIPKTQTSFDVITKAKAADVLAVQALVAYEQVKAAKGTTDALSTAQAKVAAALANVGPLIADIRNLYPPKVGEEVK